MHKLLAIYNIISRINEYFIMMFLLIAKMLNVLNGNLAHCIETQRHETIFAPISIQYCSTMAQITIIYLYSRMLAETGTHCGAVQQTHVGPLRKAGDTAHHREPRRAAGDRS